MGGKMDETERYMEVTVITDPDMDSALMKVICVWLQLIFHERFEKILLQSVMATRGGHGVAVVSLSPSGRGMTLIVFED